MLKSSDSVWADKYNTEGNTTELPYAAILQVSLELLVKLF